MVNNRLLFENFLPGPSQIVGPLGVDATSAVGFDASPLDERGVAILTVGGVASLYAIDLRTGAATISAGSVVPGRSPA